MLPVTHGEELARQVAEFVRGDGEGAKRRL
jgi:hypothetical protein